jgi:hypothetical protein
MEWGERVAERDFVVSVRDQPFKEPHNKQKPTKKIECDDVAQNL